jgi:hypothetical protein
MRGASHILGIDQAGEKILSLVIAEENIHFQNLRCIGSIVQILVKSLSNIDC